MRRCELWGALSACSAAIDRSVAARVSDRSRAGPPTGMSTRVNPLRHEAAWRGLEPEERSVGGGVGVSAVRVLEEASEVNREDLAGLQAKVRGELEKLWALVGDQPGFGAVRKLLVIHFDERVMGLLPDYLRVSWPLVQTEVTGTTTGGDDFYRLLDGAFGDPRAPSLIFEIGVWCLRHGFCGRYGRALERVEDYDVRLMQRIDRPALQPWRPDEGDELPPSSPWPLWVYNAIAVAFALSLGVALTLISNLEDSPTPAKKDSVHAPR